MALRSDWLPALAAFEAAARHQNFAHAAEELHLTTCADWSPGWASPCFCGMRAAWR